MDKSWTLGTLSSLLILTSLLYWYQNSDQSATPQVPIELWNGTQEPNIYMENVVTRVYDQTGQKQYELSSESLSDLLEITRLTAPDIWLYSEDHGAWHVTADTGLLSRDEKNKQILDLNENVLVKVLNDKEQKWSRADLEIRTEFLSINLDDELAQTDRTVMMENQSITAEGMGLMADINQGKLTLGTEKNPQRSRATLFPQKRN